MRVSANALQKHGARRPERNPEDVIKFSAKSTVGHLLYEIHITTFGTSEKRQTTCREK